MASNLQQHFTEIQRSAFRLETLSYYNVEKETGDFRRFLAGEPLPIDEHARWRERVRTAVRGGQVYERIHLLPPQLTPYLRYEIDWGYVYNAVAGEQIYLVQADESDSLWEHAGNDFWLFDDKVVALMHYDADGRFTSSTTVHDPGEVSTYRHIRDQFRQRAIPLKIFLAALRTR